MSLKISTLVEGVWRSKNCDLPLEQIILVQQFYSETFHRFLLEAFVLQRQSANCGTGRLRRHVSLNIWCSSFLLLLLLLLRLVVSSLSHTTVTELSLNCTNASVSAKYLLLLPWTTL